MATDTVLTHQQASRVIFSTSSHARISWCNEKRDAEGNSPLHCHSCASLFNQIFLHKNKCPWR